MFALSKFAGSKKVRWLPNIISFGYFIVALPVVAAIVGSLWLTATAAYENVKFARTTDQLLSLISTAREDASVAVNVGQQPNEDIIDDLIRLGQYAARPANAWGGAIRAEATSPSTIRIEADLPSLACRRLAVFFGKEAGDLALQRMEAREGGGIWRQFYNVTSATTPPTFLAIEAACGKSPNTTLAVTVRLR